MFSRLRLLPFIPRIICIILASSIAFCANAKESAKENITFSGLTLPPASVKKPDSIVVLFHGYGANSENFLFLGAFLSEFLPNTLFVATDGPIQCKAIPSGKQWLSAAQNNQPQLLKELNHLARLLNPYLDSLLKKYNLPSQKMALLGFSQGARVALHVGLRRSKCAGIIAISGSYVDDPAAKSLNRVPTLIIHGDQDQKAPVSLAKQSYQQLQERKIPVTLAILPNVGHDIDPKAVHMAAEFLRDLFNQS